MSTSVLAQDAGSGGAQDPVVLDEIVLESRLREESAEDVPFSVTAFDGAALDEQRVRDARDLYVRTPNFTILESGNPGFSVASIRGVGSVLSSASPPTGDDASVAKYVDGVPVPRLAFDSELFDVERVEVLRGPQGTLYGRNTTAGAINVFSNLPTDVFEGEVRGEVGGPRAFYELGGFVNLPLGETVSARFAAQGSIREVDTVDAATREPLGDVEIGAVRGTMVIDPDSPLRFEITAFGETREDPFYGYNALGSPGAPESDRVVQTSERDIRGASVRTTYDLDFARLTSITGYTDVDFSYRFDDTDGIIFPFPFLNAPGQYIGERDDSDEQFFQELRFSSYPGAPIQYVAGLTYIDSSYDTFSRADAPIFNNVDGIHSATTDSESLGVFGEVTASLGIEGLSGTLGARYSWDERRLRSDYENPFGRGTGPYSQDSTAEFEGFSGRASFAMEWNDRVTSYATVSRGYKPGGFLIYNANAIGGRDLPPYDETTVTSYEIGTKLASADGRYRLDVAAFLNDVTDEQIYANDGVFVSVVNADTRSYGLEVAGSALLGGGFEVTGSLGYLDAEITEAVTGVAGVPPIAKGARVPYAPEVTAALGLAYRTPLARGDLTLRADVIHRDDVAANAQESLTLDGYTLVNAGVGFDAGAYSVELFAENLFDEEFVDGIGVDFGAFGAFPGAAPGEGRRVGIAMNYRF